MRASTIRIGRLHLAVPGTTRYDGVRIVAEVRRRLERARPGARQPGTLGALRITVHAKPGASPAELAGHIADAIVRSLD